MQRNEVLLALVMFICNIIQAVTGFAGTMLAMPCAIVLTEIDTAKVVLNVVGLICCIVTAWQTRQSIHWGEFRKIVIWMTLGMVIDGLLFRQIALAFLLYFYSALIVCVALKGLFVQKKAAIPPFFMPVILIASGIIHSMFLSGGALLVVYAVRKLPDKSQFRGTLTAVWVLLNSLLLFVQLQEGLFTQQSVRLIALCLPVALLGVNIGNRIHYRINQRAFMVAANVLLLISGLIIGLF